jgi:mitotic spindle assembly checkpoint protein MAD1
VPDEKRMLHLRQVFAPTTAEFREALSAILGVKVALHDNGQVRVASQYDLGAAFVFQPAPRDAAKDSVRNNSGAARMQLVAQGEGGRAAGTASVDAELGRDRAEYTVFLGECYARVLR